MAEVTVLELAETVGTPADKLLKQMQEAELPQNSVQDKVSDEQKATLLQHLKTRHGEIGDAPRKITLKRKTVSMLKASGSSSRGRTVKVEARKKRTYVQRSKVAETIATPPVPVAELQQDAPQPSRASEEEAKRRAAAEAEAELARQREAELKAKEEEEAKFKAEEAAKLEAEAKSKKAASAPAETKVPETLEEKLSARKDKRDRSDIDEDESKLSHEGRSRKAQKERKKHVSYDEVIEELETVNLVPEDAAKETTILGLSTKGRGKSSGRRKVVSNKHKFQAPTEATVREVELSDSITVNALSQKMSVKAAQVIKSLMGLGVMATINQPVDRETAMLVIEEMGHTVKLMDDAAIEKELKQTLVYEGAEEGRIPVVTVMGHVDHGKTSLLDYIRNSQVAEGEAGGITQHIGAYQVQTDHGLICFIDTPGHAAFTAMRARGAQCTDIVILVVAADDGVMPQTEEAIQHSKAAGVPIVVAVNKIDKEGADVDRVKNELSGKELVPEDWGGDTQFVPVSAQTGEGISDLLEALLLQAEILELSAVIEGNAQGVVIESELEKGRGPVATLLVQQGTLKKGDMIVAGENFGRVRAMRDDRNIQISSAGPSTPVSVLGLNGTPQAGETFIMTTNERKARELADFRTVRAKSERLASPAVSLDNLFENMGAEMVTYLNVIIKADVRGSLEAISVALLDVGNDEVKVNIISSGVGGISESDANLAITAGAVIFGFNVRAEASTKKLIEDEGIDMRYYSVIYDIIDDVHAALSGMLSPEVREEIVGIARVKEVFRSKKFGLIAGCVVTEGTLFKQKRIRVLRDSVIIFEGDLSSLRHFKDEVEEIRNGSECGIGVKNYSDVKVNDQIEVFDTREVTREL